MILEVMEQEVKEALELCSKEEVIEIMMELVVMKHSSRVFESSEEGPKREAMIKLSLFMVMWYLNQQSKGAR